MRQQAAQSAPVPRREDGNHGAANHRLSLALMVLVSGHLGHYFCKCLMMGGFVLSNLVRNFLRAFEMLELLVFELLS